MHFSKILLAVCASTAMTYGFADIQRTFTSAGAFIEESEQNFDTADSANNQPTVSFSNADIEKKYPSTFNGNSSWMSVYPVKNARSTSGWGVRTLMGTTRHHSGVDLAAPTGTPIYATGAGIVTKSGWGSGYGNYVEIDHGNGYVTRYAHASRLVARIGQRVSAGQHIADVGCTGRCTGPHLHFEVVKDGKRQNPSTYLAMIR